MKERKPTKQRMEEGLTNVFLGRKLAATSGLALEFSSSHFQSTIQLHNNDLLLFKFAFLQE